MEKLLLPSPLHAVDYFGNLETGVAFFMKRDDLIHPIISGNKWRKLVAHFELLKRNNYQEILSFGGPYSNHVLALAAAGSSNRIKVKILVRQDENEQQNAMQQMAKWYGTTFIPVGRTAYRDKNNLVKTYTSDKTYVIPEGGFHEKSLLGCEEIIEELDQHYHHIFVAVGTGTTLAGLLKANKSGTKIHGVCVLKNASEILENLEKLQISTEHLVLHTNCIGKGYAKLPEEIEAHATRFIAETGIMLDTVYTMKCLYGAYQFMKSGAVLPNERVLMIHTGGLWGNIGYHPKS